MVPNPPRGRAAPVTPTAPPTAMRAAAFPGEDPETLKGPEVVGDAIVALLGSDFETGHRLTV